jgi:uncharacterized FAD-dependent dehydrogenase
LLAGGQVSQSNAVTRDEQKSIIEFIERAVGGAQSPMDVEADAIIRALFVRNPDAAYRMTMLAMAQQRELAAREAVTAPARTRRRWLAGLIERRGTSARREPVFAAR